MKLLPVIGVVGVLLAGLVEKATARGVPDGAQRGAQTRPVRLRPVRADASPRCAPDCDEAANRCLSRCAVGTSRNCSMACITTQVECLAQCPDAGGLFPADASIQGGGAPQPVLRTVPRRGR